MMALSFTTSLRHINEHFMCTSDCVRNKHYGYNSFQFCSGWIHAFGRELNFHS